MCRLVQDEVAGLVDRRRRTAARPDRAAEDGLHAGDELLRPERLGDVVVGAELEATQDVALVLAGGEQEHGDVLVDVPDALPHDEGRTREAPRGRGRRRQPEALLVLCLLSQVTSFRECEVY